MNNVLVRRRVGLLEAEVDGEIIGLHVEQGSCYGFNATATRVWQLIEQPTTTNDLCDALIGEYGVSREVCQSELETLLDELDRSGLVEMQPMSA